MIFWRQKRLSHEGLEVDGIFFFWVISFGFYIGFVSFTTDSSFGKSIWSFRILQFCLNAWALRGSKEDAYTCDHLEKFELATFSSRVDVEIFLFWGGNVDQPIFFAKSKKAVEKLFDAHFHAHFFICKRNISKCVPVGIVWFPDHVRRGTF